MNDELAYWNGPAGERWVREQEDRDRMLRPFGEAALASAAVAAGEGVLDVGCGCGDTLVRLAAFVGDRGRVVGLDTSTPMLGRARERCAGLPRVSFVEGDAASHPLDQGSFDLLYSRFGVMFFPDPAGAFLHLRGALRGHARLAFVCWRSLVENPWAAVPFDAVAGVLGRPEPPPPDAPGPFAFADPGRVRGILEGAGFRDVALTGFETTLVFGASGSLDDAILELARHGPASRLLVDRDEPTVSRAHAALRAALSPYVSGGGQVHLRGSAWVVTARNGPATAVAE
jgi:SAM-dependent methyltransferase